MDAAQATNTLMSFLGSRMKIDVIDGRQLIGTFNCIDKDCNIVLLNANEIIDDSFPERAIGTIVVSRENLRKIYLQG